MTYRVQRSYGLGWDIWPDQPDVPAIFDSFHVFSHGKRLSQEPHSDPFGFSLHGCRNLDEHSFGFSILVGTALSDKPHETYFLLLRRLGIWSTSVRIPFSNYPSGLSMNFSFYLFGL